MSDDGRGDDEDNEDRPTLVICASCGGRDKIVEQCGNGNYRIHNCRWCTNGAMTPAQYDVYRAYLRARRQQPS